MPIESELEWDCFTVHREVQEIQCPGPLPPGTTAVTINRDDSYDLDVRFGGAPTTSGASSLADANDESPAGTILEGETVSGLCEHGDEIIFEGLVQSTNSLKLGIGKPSSFSGTGHVLEAILKVSPNAATATHVDWFLNGPSNRGEFSRKTARTIRPEYRRTREPTPKSSDATLRSSSLARDHFQVSSGDLRFIVAKVPEDFGPSWARCLSIEFQGRWGIPDPETRDGISEIISFLLGRQLLDVGTSQFDEDDNLTTATARSPWEKVARELSTHETRPPIHFEPLSRQIETVASDLVSRYLELRSSLDLSTSIWNYWMARNAPTGFNLVYMASALEGLVSKWSKSSGSKRKGLYMPKPEYQELLGDLLGTAEERLRDHEFSDKILGRLRHGYSMSGSDVMRNTLDEIGIVPGTSEQRAIKNRNIAAHGRTASNPKLSKDYYAYECLFHRTLLKVLGYSGSYVDYRSLGYPSRSLDTPPGE